MVNNYIVIPLAFQIIAIIFSPVGLALSTACNVNPFNNPDCGVIFTSQQSIAFTATGYSYVVAQAAQNCSQLQINGVTMANIPILGTIAQLPILGGALNYIIGLIQGVRTSFDSVLLHGYTITNSPQGEYISSPVPIGNDVFQNQPYLVNSTQGQEIVAQYNVIDQQAINSQQLANACLKGSQALFIISFNPQDILLLFISAVATAAAISAVSSTVLNAGGALIIFKVSSLSLIYLILTGLAFPTWAIIPSPFGSTLYAFLTLGFALGTIGDVGSIAA